MSTTRYPPQSFEAMSRKQAITTCYALEDMRDKALAEVERQLAGRGIEQMMLTNALPELAALDRVQSLCSDAEDSRPWISVAELRAAIEGNS